MKKLLPLFVCFFAISSFQTQAGHVLGTDLNYQYIGDSTGTPHEYEVNLILYRKGQPSAAPLDPLQTVKIWNNCGYSDSLVLQRFIPAGATPVGNGGAYIPGFGECVDTSISTFHQVETHHYRGTIVLPGQCLYTFAWEMCCRNADITNLGGSPSGYSIYNQTTLDNTYGPNSGLRFHNPAVRTHCVDVSRIWGLGGIEPDNDSIRYRPAQPTGTLNAPLPWAPGYSLTQPITSAHGVSFNSTSGDMSFHPAAVENAALKIIAEEYRYDSTTNQWVLIGETQREIQAVILTTCSSILPHSDFAITGDSLGQGVLPELPCETTVINVKSSIPVMCESIDLYDFTLFAQQGQIPMPVIEVGADSCFEGATTNFWLKLHKSLNFNDTLEVILKKGMRDGNTLITSCGHELAPFDTIVSFYVDCGSGIGISEIAQSRFTLYPNPAKDYLEIHFEEPMGERKIQLLDLQGKALKEMDAAPKTLKIDISDLPKGMYLIRSSESQRAEVFRKM